MTTQSTPRSPSSCTTRYPTRPSPTTTTWSCRRRARRVWRSSKRSASTRAVTWDSSTHNSTTPATVAARLNHSTQLESVVGEELPSVAPRATASASCRDRSNTMPSTTAVTVKTTANTARDTGNKVGRRRRPLGRAARRARRRRPARDPSSRARRRCRCAGRARARRAGARRRARDRRQSPARSLVGSQRPSCCTATTPQRVSALTASASRPSRGECPCTSRTHSGISSSARRRVSSTSSPTEAATMAGAGRSAATPVGPPQAEGAPQLVGQLGLERSAARRAPRGPGRGRPRHRGGCRDRRRRGRAPRRRRPGRRRAAPVRVRVLGATTRMPPSRPRSASATSAAARSSAGSPTTVTVALTSTSTPTTRSPLGGSAR